jgi:hypothetical protein
MNQPNGSGSDPIDRLRLADPARADEVPDASLARVTARIQEHIVTDLAQTPTTRPARRSFAMFGGVILTGAFALALAVGTGLGLPAPTSDPGTGGGAAGGGTASCLAYDPAALPMFDIVFDGTVTAVNGDQITFDVNEGWKGADGSITLTAPMAEIALTGPVPDFEIGDRYLVSAAGSTINSCGFTLAYDAGAAASWAAAFAG